MIGKHLSSFKELEQLLSPEDNYSHLRSKMLSISNPCVPWVGLYLRDLTYLNDGYPTMLKGSNLINFEKCRRLATVLKEIEKFQKIPFNFVEDLDIRSYILKMEELPSDENQMYSLSLQVEPVASTQ